MAAKPPPDSNPSLKADDGGANADADADRRPAHMWTLLNNDAQAAPSAKLSPYAFPLITLGVILVWLALDWLLEMPPSDS